MRADVYLTARDALNVWAFEHRVVRQVDDDEIFLAPVEAMILNKLRYYQWEGRIGIHGISKRCCASAETW